MRLGRITRFSRRYSSMTPRVDVVTRRRTITSQHPEYAKGGQDLCRSQRGTVHGTVDANHVQIKSRDRTCACLRLDPPAATWRGAAGRGPRTVNAKKGKP